MPEINSQTGFARQSRWPELIAGATLFFACYTFASYFWEPWRAPLMALLQLCVTVLIATGCGRVLLRVLGFSDVSDSQKTLIGCTMGLAILSFGTLGLAALHALSGLSTAFLLAALWLVGFTEMRAVVLSLTSNRNLLGERPAPAAAIFFFMLLVFWMTWVPPHEYDSLVYHLPIAQAYVRAHGLVPTNVPIYSGFPQNGEMLFALALVMRSDLLAQMFMWLAMVLSVWWVFELGKREAPLSAVLLSCVLLVTHTSIMLLGSTSYVEPLVMLWTTAAVFSFMRWRQVRAADPEQRSWLALSALFTGFALGTKYYAGITAALLGLYLLWRVIREKDARLSAALDGALFTCVVTALFMPWMVKNAIFAGNPFAPFFNYLFKRSASGLYAEYAKGYFGAITEYRHGAGYFSDLAQLPIMLLTNSLHFGRGMDVLGGLGWELLFWSAPLAAWVAWRNKFLRALAVFCAAYLLVWFSTGVVLRFLSVLAPLMCLLVGCGLYQLWTRLSSWGRWILGAALTLLIACHVLLFLFVQFGVFSAGEVLLGLKDRDQYLGQRLDYYPCARFAEDRLPPTDKILIAGDQRSYYVVQDHLASTIFGQNRFVTWANEAASPEQLARRIRAEGYAAILYVPREFERLGPAFGQFTERGAKNWSQLEPAFAQPAYRSQGCTLYTIAEPHG